MLIELVVAIILAPVTSCDTARAALGSCSTQLSSSLTGSQGFQLNLSRETQLAGSQTSQPASSSTTTTAAPTPANSVPVTTVAPKPAATTAAPKPAATTAAPKPVSTPKPVAAKPAASAPANPAAAASSGCPVLDPPQARLYMPPCPAKTPAPKPAPKPAVAPKPATTAAAPVARPPATPPLVQTVSAPATSSRTPSRSYTEQDEFAARVPTPALSLSPGLVRVGAEVSFTVTASAVTNAGTLLGQPAEIRFTPIAARINPGEGPAQVGFKLQHRYRAVGWYSAQAQVSYRVDYRLGSGNWVLNAATIDSLSNVLAVQVLEPRKRSLLVD